MPWPCLNSHTFFLQRVCNSQAKNMASKMCNHKNWYETSPDGVIIQDMAMQVIAKMHPSHKKQRLQNKIKPAITLIFWHLFIVSA